MAALNTGTGTNLVPKEMILTLRLARFETNTNTQKRSRRYDGQCGRSHPSNRQNSRTQNLHLAKGAADNYDGSIKKNQPTSRVAKAKTISPTSETPVMVSTVLDGTFVVEPMPTMSKETRLRAAIGIVDTLPNRILIVMVVNTSGVLVAPLKNERWHCLQRRHQQSSQ